MRKLDGKLKNDKKCRELVEIFKEHSLTGDANLRSTVKTCINPEEHLQFETGPNGDVLAKTPERDASEAQLPLVKSASTIKMHLNKSNSLTSPRLMRHQTLEPTRSPDFLT